MKKLSCHCGEIKAEINVIGNDRISDETIKSFIDVKINYNSFLTNGNEYNYVNIKKCLEKLEDWLSNL